MTNPIEILIQLNKVTEDLDRVQSLINYGRSNDPMNQSIQLELDRRQTDVDIRRDEIEMAKIAIARLN